MYLREFIEIAILHFLAVASPGPDFAVTARYSLAYGRRIGRWVAVGIGTGILVHVAYSLLGVTLIIHRYQWVYATLLLLGALYLGWIGSQAIRARPRAEQPNAAAAAGELSRLKGFRIGFITNGLNVKATLFFMALFTAVINPATPTLIKVGYGFYLAVATGLWFVLLATLLTIPAFYQRIWAYGHWLDRVMGVFLIVLCGKLIIDWFAVIQVLLNG
ncbi:Threonine efflux protein [Pseudidiomarina piscicola]|uniref:Threonine efflux protein n=1 Tax=Pseudidiomarina piscicola TaxID=2614830 RepID=A0A6S6WTL0_9GAMM|nr:LysE family translocator [Pseudidiomarina piscicola]CAB0149990.1 Threonine efflux protein [Pseudidiomarina piscicola]VZT39437.1 Threonine efflux protein [Pseudomonas aeruginosa]